MKKIKTTEREFRLTDKELKTKLNKVGITVKGDIESIEYDKTKKEWVIISIENYKTVINLNNKKGVKN